MDIRREKRGAWSGGKRRAEALRGGTRPTTPNGNLVDAGEARYHNQSMVVFDFQYLSFKALQVWWPESVGAVYDLLDKSPIVLLWQCPKVMVEQLQPYAFRIRPFWTPLVDLSLSEDVLWRQLDRTSCRQEISRAQKMGATILHNEEMESARLLINESIRRLGYRSELGPAQWQELFPRHEVFLCKWQGTPVTADVILPDHPRRARPVVRGTVDRGDPRYHKVVGPLNRLMHWAEFQHYKVKGFRYYDFGGCDVDKNSPTYPITLFKLSFGCEVVEEPMVFLAKNPILRTTLRTTANVRSLLQKTPWSAGVVRTIKKHPRLASLFR